MAILNIVASIVFLLITVAFFSLFLSSFSSAPWVPTRRKDMNKIFELLDLKPGEVFYDLGAGNGNMTIMAAKKYQARAIGIELALPMYLICKAREFFNLTHDIEFKLKSFFREDLSKADAVYLFGYPATIKNKVKSKLEKELKPGARVVSYAFKITGWKPIKVDKTGRSKTPIYLYII